MAVSCHPHDALAVLQAEHEEVRRLVRAFERARKDDNPVQKRAVALDLCSAFERVATVQRELFHPAAAAVLQGEDRALLDKSAVIRQGLHDLVARIRAMPPGDPSSDALVLVLAELRTATCGGGARLKPVTVRCRRGGEGNIPGTMPVDEDVETTQTPATVLGHGGRVLPEVTVDTCNEELRDEEGFVGDRASGRAFRAILEDWRDKLRAQGEDPVGDTPTREITKAKLDKMLAEGDPMAAGLVHTEVEEYAVELATVVRRFLRLEQWQGTERIVIGGGLSASHIGELAMGRAGVLLKTEGQSIDLRTIDNHPDKAGLIGAVHLAREFGHRLPKLEGHEPVVVIHNDAVVQGLSEIPAMTDVEHWGVLTIGTGLGNARFTNRKDE